MEDGDAIVEQWFEQALDLPDGQRSDFLDTACGNRPELRRRVEAMLAEHERLTGFLSHAAWTAADRQLENFNGESGLSRTTRLGRYTLLEQLGAGGMGLVSRARDEKLERIVAIKVLSQGFLTSESARGRFRTEALALARLNHPSIAALFDVGEQDGIDYLVMECVPGQSLREKMLDGPLTVVEATRSAIVIAVALYEAHAQRVVHRDL